MSSARIAGKPELRYGEPIVLSLTVAANNVEYPQGGNSLVIVGATGQVFVRLNEPDNPLINLNQAFTINAPFYRLFFTWAAQAGLVATILINTTNMVASGVPVTSFTTITGLPINLLQAAITPTVYNVTLVANDTEYSQLLPVNAKRFEMHILDDSVSYRVAFVAGKVAGPVAPYMQRAVGAYYSEDSLLLAAVTVYFAGAAVAGKVMEIVAWT